MSSCVRLSPGFFLSLQVQEKSWISGGIYQLMVQVSFPCPSVIARRHQRGGKERAQSSICFNNYFALLSRHPAERLSSHCRATDKMNDERLKKCRHESCFPSNLLFLLPPLPPFVKWLKAAEGGRARCLDFVTCKMQWLVPSSSCSGSTVSYNFSVTTNTTESQPRVYFLPGQSYETAYILSDYSHCIPILLSSQVFEEHLWK